VLPWRPAIQPAKRAQTLRSVLNDRQAAADLPWLDGGKKTCGSLSKLIFNTHGFCRCFSQLRSAAWGNGSSRQGDRGSRFCQLNRPGHEAVVAADQILQARRHPQAEQLGERSSATIQEEIDHISRQAGEALRRGFLLRATPTGSYWCGKIRAMMANLRRSSTIRTESLLLGRPAAQPSARPQPV